MFNNDYICRNFVYFYKSSSLEKSNGSQIVNFIYLYRICFSIQVIQNENRMFVHSIQKMKVIFSISTNCTKAVDRGITALFSVFGRQFLTAFCKSRFFRARRTSFSLAFAQVLNFVFLFLHKKRWFSIFNYFLPTIFQFSQFDV